MAVTDMTFNEAVRAAALAYLTGGGGGVGGSVTLLAGSAIVGKVGIDQTTPGSTNAVVMTDTVGDPIDFADPATGAVVNIGDSATAVSLLAANAARKGATLRNNSTAIAYVNFSTEDPTSVECSVEMAARTSLGAAYVEVPAGYTGQIKAIWASDAGGFMSVTELT